MQVDAVTGDFVANDIELERLVRAFTQDGDADIGVSRALQQVSYFTRIHVVSGFAVNCNDDVARADSSAIGRRACKWRDYDDLIVAWTHLHAYAVIFSALFFTQLGVLLVIKEIRVG